MQTYEEPSLSELYKDVPTTLKNRVRRGAAFLDVKEPGWHTRIDLDGLKLENNFTCVLGQLHGTYPDGAQALGMDETRLRSAVYTRGFTISIKDYNKYDGEDTDAWTYLTIAWKHEITQRREQTT